MSTIAEYLAIGAMIFIVLFTIFFLGIEFVIIREMGKEFRVVHERILVNWKRIKALPVVERRKAYIRLSIFLGFIVLFSVPVWIMCAYVFRMTDR